MTKSLLTISLLFVATVLRAQDQKSDLSHKEIKRIQKQQLIQRTSNGDIRYDHEFNAGGRLNTDGWSAYLEYSKRSSETTSTLFQFEIGEKKAPKEDKQSGLQYRDPYTGIIYSVSKPFVYGKQNIFYQAKLGIGQRRLIGSKGNKNGVEVSAVYMAGVSLGLVRPYYLQVDSLGGTFYIKYSEESRDKFLGVSDILGGSGLKKGWNEMQLVPGIHAKLGMRFDWAQFNEVVSAVEVGLNAEAYTKKIPIMVDNKSKQFFFNAYVSLLFGKRW